MNVATPTEAAMAESKATLADAPCFIEQQFPVAKLSMESYAERRANQAQLITSLGKWWGRKPLVLVRAALLGLLMPASDNPEKDRDVFLKLMTMDQEGLRRRKGKSIPGRRLIAELLTMPPSVQRRFLDPEAPPEEPSLRRLSREERKELQQIVFDHMSYEEKLQYCDRPEQIDGPSEEAWAEINTHLGSNATSLPGLVEELGKRRFGRRPQIGDALCGSGAIPFEAARLGCDVYGADLNPVAALITWSALNIVGGSEDTFEDAQEAQRVVFEEVDRQIAEWGIEHNSLGWRADAYLYCTEVVDPETGWKVPLAPRWVIAPKTRTIARLISDEGNQWFDIEIRNHVSQAEMRTAQEGGTVKNSRLIPPYDGPSTPIDVIRRDMRLWEREEVVPRPDDVFQERLYCIRWEETYIDENGRERTRRHYRSVTVEDAKREARALKLLQERFYDWQMKGYIPSRRIEPGEKTDEPIRTRGWTYWHHLFTPRQLLIIGLLQETSDAMVKTKAGRTINLLAIGRYADWNSKLCRWGTGAARESIGQTFTNQALNTQYSFASKAYRLAAGTWFINARDKHLEVDKKVIPLDCRQTKEECDIWITDPPYADAVNYHELSEYFLTWYDKRLLELFPGWYSDSKRVLAVQGSDTDFRKSMVDCYRRLTEQTTGSGLQVVMFTHQEPAIWADLTMILWAAGLSVSSAWCIQTEREAAGVRVGNYVQGTVLLVLRRRKQAEPVFLDEITHKIEAEVRRQLDTMLTMEDDSDPNFGDADYPLAAYAAALRVLTAQPIEEIDPAKEILREHPPGEVSRIEEVIRSAVKIACDHLVPRDFDTDLWKHLLPMERFYLKGLEVESHAEYRSGVYQELARGFGAMDYTDLLASTRANETRLKSASEMGRRILSGDGFGSSLVRQCLFAIHQVVRSDETQDGLNWLRTELPDYWSNRERIVHILGYLAALEHVSAMKRWRKDGHAAALLAGAVRNDHV
jgi:putative DNA methylase